MTESYIRFFQMTEAPLSKEVTDKDLWLPPRRMRSCALRISGTAQKPRTEQLRPGMRKGRGWR